MTTAIYARQSFDRAGEGAAIARQVTACSALAEQHGLVVDRQYLDNDVSATTGRRPGFEGLLADVRAGDVDIVLVWHTDRLYRRLRDLVELVELAEQHSLRILTVKAGDIDLTNPGGRMLAQMLGAAARYEIESKSARQIAANRQRAEAGLPHFAQRPYGYERVGNEIRIVETEAAILRESINRYVGGESWYAIAKDLRARGIASQKGRDFTPTNLEKRCRNPRLAGIRTYNGVVVNEHGLWEPIIDRETYEAMEAMRIHRRQESSWDKTLKHLGSGIYRCGKCGARMFVSTDYGKKKKKGEAAPNYPYYLCEHLDTRRKLAPVDEMVEHELLNRITMWDVVALVAPSEGAAHLMTDAREVKARLDGLVELFADGALSRASVSEQKEKLTAELDSLARRLQAIEGGLDLTRLVQASSVEDFWNNKLNIRAKRRILRTLMTVTILPVNGPSNVFRSEEVVIRWREPELDLGLPSIE